MIGDVSLFFRDALDGAVQSGGIDELRAPFQTDDLGLKMPLVPVKTNIRDRVPT